MQRIYSNPNHIPAQIRQIQSTALQQQKPAVKTADWTARDRRDFATATLQLLPVPVSPTTSVRLCTTRPEHERARNDCIPHTMHV